jgi:electron transfer flavoprotein alpha subunit
MKHMIIVYSDNKKTMLELLNGAQTLAKDLQTKVAATNFGDSNQAKEYIHHGADQVITIETKNDQYQAEPIANILQQIMEQENATALLIGSTKNGKELAPRIAAAMDVGCVTDAYNLTLKDNKLTVDRIEYSGNAVSTQQFQKTPYILTIPPKLYTPMTPDTNRKGETKTFTPTDTKNPSKITDIKTQKSEGVNVEDAEIIVSCGRGFKNKEDIKIIQELADVLKGYTVGCSRPIAADLKWLSEDHWIGLSGHKVKPKLYVAVGISGQIQHIAGMRDSSIIVAINKDPEALIFNSADYGIVGDLYEVIPKLTEAIKAKMG